MSPPTELAVSTTPARSPDAALGALRFRYRAYHPDGTLEQGSVSALDRAAVSARLTARGLFPETVTAEGRQAADGIRVGAADLARGLRMLSSLLSAGLPMERALGVFEHVAPPEWTRGGIETIRQATREGSGLAESLRASGIRFPEYVLGMVDVGVTNGALPANLRRAAEELEASASTRDAIRAALAYPLLLAVSGVLSTAILVGVVLPRFAVIIADLGQQLPASARLLMSVSDVARSAFLPAIAVGAGATVLLVRWMRVTPGASNTVATILLRVPVLGPFSFSIAASRASATLGALLASGLQVASALPFAARASGNAAIETRLHLAREQVLNGEALSTAFAACSAVPEASVALIRAGEATGEVAEMLSYTARLERERTENEIRRLVRLIEPTLILAIGALVAFVAATLLQAVYSVRPTP